MLWWKAYGSLWFQHPQSPQGPMCSLPALAKGEGVKLRPAGVHDIWDQAIGHVRIFHRYASISSTCLWGQLSEMKFYAPHIVLVGNKNSIIFLKFSVPNDGSVKLGANIFLIHG